MSATLGAIAHAVLPRPGVTVLQRELASNTQRALRLFSRGGDQMSNMYLGQQDVPNCGDASRRELRLQRARSQIQRRRQRPLGWKPRVECRRRIIDTPPAVEHPKSVVTVLQRLAAVALSLALSAGNAAVCAGWAPTPEARMACCSKSGACPMHKGTSHGSGSGRVLTQAQADSCCASSEPEHSSQSNPTFVTAISSAVLGPAIVLPPSVPALVLSHRSSAAAPIPSSAVPRHLLLSVFLV